MKYSAVQYAVALHGLVRETPPAKWRGMARDFIAAISKNGSLSAVPEIIREFELLADTEAKIHRVLVQTPERLPEAEVSRALPFKAHVKAVRDTRLHGGAVIEADGVRVDNSIKMRLERVREALTK